MDIVAPVVVVLVVIALLHLAEKHMRSRYSSPPLPGLVSGGAVFFAVIAGRALGDALSLGGWWDLALGAVFAGLGYSVASLIWTWRKVR